MGTRGPKGKITVGLHEFTAAKEAYRAERDAAGRTVYSEDDIDLLEWFWHWMQGPRMRGDMGKVAQRVGYDASKIPQIMRGNYGASIRNFLEVVAQVRQDVDQGEGEFVRTCVTAEIEKALDMAYNRRFLGILSGRTGRSKTHTVRHWADAHNHGQTVYVRCRSACTRSKLVRLVGSAIGRGKAHNARTLMLEDDIFAHFDQRRRKMLIIDEANHMLRLGTTTAIAQAFEFLRDLYDCCNTAVVLVLTDYDMSAFRHGKMAEFFEQFRGRCQLYREIPDRIFAEEIRDICAAYVDDPPDDLIRTAHAIASGDDGKLRTLFEYLNLARELGERRDTPLTADLIKTLHQRHETGGVWPSK